MNFFDPKVKEKYLHKNFRSVMLPHRGAERDMFQSWAEGFVDRDGKIIKEFQISFNSTFWEIYLHSAFKEYGFTTDWSNSSPDFALDTGDFKFVVEAVTAGAAQNKPNEWDKNFSEEELKVLRCFRALNTEAIIRISNSILKKIKMYNETYRKLAHVKGKPFVLAVAPFEQPHFNHQYDRPIKALLYDHYVDEDAYLESPEDYPNGPPKVNLGFVEKDNGAEIPLGIFNDSSMSEISAIVFSCVATWGKLSAMSINGATDTTVYSTWATPPNGVPEKRVCTPQEHDEGVLDGLQVFHNPFARYPLPPAVFRSERVVQLYVNFDTGKWVHEGDTTNLQFRQVIASPKSKKPSNKKN